MSVQSTLVIIAGINLPKNVGRYFDIPEANEFTNFESHAEENMDGNLKFLVGDEYTILGLPLSVTYLDEGEYLDPYALGNKTPLIINQVAERIKELNKTLKLSCLENPCVEIHILTHVT